jgi:hypothetical protein
VFLGAAITMTRKDARLGLINHLKDNKSIVHSFLLRFAFLVFLCALYFSLLPIISFTWLSQFTDADISQIMVYLLGTIAAAPIIALVFCPIGMLFAMALDDWKFTTFSGAGSFLAITLITGLPYAKTKYPELMLLGPVHFYAATAAVLSMSFGYVSSYVASYIGVNYGAQSLVVPGVILSSIAIVSLIVAFNLFKQNILRWQTDSAMWSPEETQKSIFLQKQVDSTSSFKLERRRQLFSVIIISLIVIFSVTSYFYSQAKEDEITTTLYTSVGGEEYVLLGMEIRGEFEITHSLSNIIKEIGFRLDILDWGDTPDEMWLQFHVHQMDLSEYFEMNETEKWPIHYGHNIINDQTTPKTYNRQRELPSQEGTFVWAMRFVDENWNITEGSLKISLTVFLKEIQEPVLGGFGSLLLNLANSKKR